MSLELGAQSVEKKLPVHGFVLAGGKSSRMGADKALLEFGGRALVEIAVGKLRGFCAAVSVVGERAELDAFAPVVRGERAGVGPGGGVEAGLQVSAEAWALFVPVDVPLVPEGLLRAWAEALLAEGTESCGVSYLVAGGEAQPAFCMLRWRGVRAFSEALERGERSLRKIFQGMEEDAGEFRTSIRSVESLMPGATAPDVAYWFSNLNTRGEFEAAELWAKLRG